jgi:hypothetical protein
MVVENLINRTCLLGFSFEDVKGSIHGAHNQFMALNQRKTAQHPYAYINDVQ